MSSAVSVRVSLQDAFAEVRNAFARKHAFALLSVLVIAVLPVATDSTFMVRSLAWVFYYAAAAVGLNLIMGLGNMASLGHGAFVALGALFATFMRTRIDTGFVVAVVAATGATAIAAWLVGRGAIRLRAIHLAVASWLGAWLVMLVLASFPEISGGTGGIVIPDATMGWLFGATWRLTPISHYEVALLLLVAALVSFGALQRSSIGLTLATVKQNPREASAIGTLRDDVRLKLFVFGSSIAGCAGSLGVHLSGIFDQRSFGVLLSISLFLAVLLGGPGRWFGPLVGTIAVSLLPIGGQPLIPFASTSTRAGELIAGLVLLTIIALRSRYRPSPVPSRSPTSSGPPPEIASFTPPRLAVERVGKRFGGLEALCDVDLQLEAGRVHGIMGPNGSGKSTLLALISGHRFPDEGRIVLDGEDITSLPARQRLKLGIARSLQSTELFGDLTALDHLEAAGLVDLDHDNFARALLRTPRARMEERASRSRALELLRDLGLEGHRDRRAAEIPAGARRLLMMGAAIAGRRVILLDEPSAGMSPAEVRRAAGIILELKRLDQGYGRKATLYSSFAKRFAADTATPRRE